MAVPIAAIAKAAAAVLSNEKTRKTVGWVIAAILSSVILLIGLICSLMSGTADHNNTAVDLTFHGGSITAHTYTLRVNNSGNVAANNVVITHVIPNVAAVAYKYMVSPNDVDGVSVNSKSNMVNTKVFTNNLRQ